MFGKFLNKKIKKGAILHQIYLLTELTYKDSEITFNQNIQYFMDSFHTFRRT